MENYNTSDVLEHHGIKGMKWGVRRYQNPDGSLTAAGKKKYGTKTNFEKVQAVKRAGERKISKETIRKAKANARTEKEIAKLKKKYGLEDETKKEKEPTLDEIREATTMLNAKNAYDRELQTYQKNHPTEMSRGQKFVKSAMNDVIIPAAKNVGKQYVEKQMRTLLGLPDNKDGDKKNNDGGGNKQNNKPNNQQNNKPNNQQNTQTNTQNNPNNNGGNGKKNKDKKNKQSKNNEPGNQQENTNSGGKSNQKNKNTQKSTKSNTSETEYMTGDVVGEGTSKRRADSGKSWSKKNDEIFDTVYRDVTPDTNRLGINYVNQYLLEDKRR